MKLLHSSLPVSFIRAAFEMGRSFRHGAVMSLVISVIFLSLAAPVRPAPLFEELFTDVDNGKNHNVNSVDWEAYGGNQATDLSSLTPGDSLNSSVFISDHPGHPSPPNGFLAVVCGGGYDFTQYAIVKTHAGIQDPGSFVWQMNSSVRASVEVRLLVQVDDKWYASRSAFYPTSVGDMKGFPTAEDTEKTLEFNPAAGNWAEFTLEAGKSMALGGDLKSDIPSGKLTGFGLYISGKKGAVVRIDTFQILPKK